MMKPAHVGLASAALVAFLLLADNFAPPVLPRGPSPALLRALVDSGAHALTAGWQWLLLSRIAPLERVSGPPYLLLACVLGSVLDADHFIAARSLSLKAAVSQPQRPLLHATPIVAIPLLALVLIASRMRPRLQWLPCMALAAWLSHHVRDAYRRGLWLWPLSHGSLPVPYPAYLALELALPWLLARLVRPPSQPLRVTATSIV
eukprot:m.14477 g.14477  ORF g.14477 m.14477 type:complete len:204 (+) comp2938_c0_seq2:256-867(+)